jgi:two-component system, LytTR family, response regulator
VSHCGERAHFLNWLQSSTDFGAAKGRLVVKRKGRILLLDADSVQWVAAGDYVRLYVAKQNYLMRETTRSLEERLDPQSLVRIHRSAIVNLDFVAGLR